MLAAGNELLIQWAKSKLSHLTRTSGKRREKKTRQIKKSREKKRYYLQFNSIEFESSSSFSSRKGKKSRRRNTSRE
jgi:hypothetical protein